eukprot:2234769-Rhodomonas_salina.1
MFGSSSFGPASKRRNSRSALQLIPLVVDSPLDKILRNRRPSIVQDAGSEPSSNFVERYDRLGSPDIEDKPGELCSLRTQSLRDARCSHGVW